MCRTRRVVDGGNPYLLDFPPPPHLPFPPPPLRHCDWNRTEPPLSIGTVLVEKENFFLRVMTDTPFERDFQAGIQSMSDIDKDRPLQSTLKYI